LLGFARNDDQANVALGLVPHLIAEDEPRRYFLVAVNVALGLVPHLIAEAKPGGYFLVAVNVAWGLVPRLVAEDKPRCYFVGHIFMALWDCQAFGLW